MNLRVLRRATRAYSLPASVVPVMLGTVLAARGFGGVGRGTFHASTFVIALVGGVLAHFGANVINDYFDFVKGVDTRPEHGSGVLTTGQMTPRGALAFALGLLAGAAVCGVLLLHTNPTVVASLSVVGLGCAVLYPALLKRYGLGDLLIVIAFGVGLTLGAYGVQVGTLGARQWLLVAVYSVPVCLLVDAILHANNLRDAADDRTADVRTLATMLGSRRGQILQAVLLFGPLVFVIVGIACRLLPVWSAATVVAVPLLVGAYRSGSVPGTAQTHLLFGLLYALSFLPRPLFI
jgi:1,4-dihydroxy-2-naphthoate octaprenyltransferase